MTLYSLYILSFCAVQWMAMENDAAAKTPCDTLKSNFTLCSPIFMQYLPGNNQSLKEHSKTNKEAFQYLIYILSHQSNMHDLHAFCGTFTHTVQYQQRHSHTYTHTHMNPVGGEDLLSALVQEGLCVAAAVGLTSLQPAIGLQYHCYSSIHTSDRDRQSLHKLVNYAMKNRNFLLIYYEFQTPAVYCSTITKQTNYKVQ